MVKPYQAEVLFVTSSRAVLHWQSLEISALHWGWGSLCLDAAVGEVSGKGQLSLRTSKEKKSLQKPFLLIAPLLMQGGLR